MSTANEDTVNLLVALARVIIDTYDGAATTEPAKANGRPAKATAAPAKAAPAKLGRTVAAVAVEEDETVDYNKTDIRLLRKDALARGFNAAAVKAASKADLVQSLIDDDGSSETSTELDDDDAGTDDDDDADDDADDEGYSRDELEAMDMAELKAILKANEWTTAELRGLDSPTLVAMILGEAGDDEAGDDEAADDEADDDDDEEGDEDEGYTEEALTAMSRTELLAIAKELGVRVRKGTLAPAIVAAIIEAQEDEDE